jgi:hypothetical protein
MVTDPAYSLIRTAATAVALGAAVVLFGTYLRQLRQLRQLRRYRRPLRLASVAAAGIALCALLLVTSPLDYRASAPAPAGLKLYVLSTSNDLFMLRASDGAQTFVRDLPGPQLQMRYHEGGLLILAGPGHDVPVAIAGTAGSTGTAGNTGTAGTAAGASAAATGQVGAYTLQAVRGIAGALAETGSRAGRVVRRPAASTLLCRSSPLSILLLRGTRDACGLDSRAVIGG